MNRSQRRALGSLLRRAQRRRRKQQDAAQAAFREARKTARSVTAQARTAISHQWPELDYWVDDDPQSLPYPERAA